jgi:DNA-binding GntR family transcriptional regulator
MTPSRPTTLGAHAEAAIQDAILSGQYPPGARLPIQEIAESLGLSQMPVRDALRRLAATGLVDYRPHHGAHVAQLSVEDLRDTWDARLALETLAIRRAAVRFEPAQVAPIEAAIRRHTEMLLAGEAAEARSAHREVHMGLYEASGYNWVERLLDPLWGRSERYRTVALVDRGSPEQLGEEHRQILAACVEHAEELAATRLYDHLVKTANLLAEKMAGIRLFGPAGG